MFLRGDLSRFPFSVLSATLESFFFGWLMSGNKKKKKIFFVLFFRLHRADDAYHIMNEVFRTSFCFFPCPCHARGQSQAVTRCVHYDFACAIPVMSCVFIICKMCDND